jgi:hypothetical protein
LKRMGVYCVSTRAIHLDAICGMTDGHMDRQKKNRQKTDRETERKDMVCGELLELIDS